MLMGDKIQVTYQGIPQLAKIVGYEQQNRETLYHLKIDHVWFCAIEQQLRDGVTVKENMEVMLTKTKRTIMPYGRNKFI